MRIGEIMSPTVDAIERARTSSESWDSLTQPRSIKGDGSEVLVDCEPTGIRCQAQLFA